MWVDVVELCRLGVRRPREEVRAATPLRAELDLDRLWTWSTVDRERAQVHAHLMPMVFEPLYKARVVLMRRHHILICGQQRAVAPGPRAKEELYDQMWWCRVVRTVLAAQTSCAEPLAQPAPDPSAAHLSGRKTQGAVER
jgi:hypothetical protein